MSGFERNSVRGVILADSRLSLLGQSFLANVDHESGGLRYVKEINTANYSHYCDRSQPYGCPAGQSAYYGKGPIQLSWNYNYKAAGDAQLLFQRQDTHWTDRGLRCEPTGGAYGRRARRSRISVRSSISLGPATSGAGFWNLL